MWYFSWVLGVSFAISFSIINALWLEEKDLAAASARSAPRTAYKNLISKPGLVQ
jgi:cyd operon protein YbgT